MCVGVQRLVNPYLQRRHTSLVFPSPLCSLWSNLSFYFQSLLPLLPSFVNREHKMAGIKLNRREIIGKCGGTFWGLVEVNWTKKTKNRWSKQLLWSTHTVASDPDRSNSVTFWMPRLESEKYHVSCIHKSSHEKHTKAPQHNKHPRRGGRCLLAASDWTGSVGLSVCLSWRLDLWICHSAARSSTGALLPLSASDFNFKPPFPAQWQGLSSQ